MNQLSPQRRNDLICYLLVLVTLAVYWPVRHFQFVSYDDGSYVYQNPHVRAGLTIKGIAWAFTTHDQSNWHPLTWISHMADTQVFGLDAGAHHMVNVFIHVADTLLLFFVLKRMTAAPWRSAFVAALFALHPLHVESVAWIAERKDVLSGFFFMLTLWAYVRYVEKLSVIRDQLSGKQTSTNHPSPITNHGSQVTIFYLLTLLFFALGLMSKPMVVTLPFVLLLLDYWPLGRMGDKTVAAGLPPGQQGGVSSRSGGFRLSLRRKDAPVKGAATGKDAPIKGAATGKDAPVKGAATGKDAPVSRVRRDAAVVCGNDAATRKAVSLPTLKRLIIEKLPFFALSALSCVVTVWAQRAESISSLEVLPFGKRLANAVVAYVLYLGKTIWPSRLAVFYPYPNQPVVVVLGCIAVLLAISALVLWWGRRKPQFLVGWLWFLGTLVPVIGLVQVGGQSLADRYAYLPSIGLFLMVGWAIPDYVFEPHRVEANQDSDSCGPAARPACNGAPWLQRITAAFAIALLCACAVVCRLQVRYWQNTETLFRHALAVTQNNWLAHYDLGVYLMKQGELDEAIEHYERSVQIRPDNFEPHNNLAFALRKAGRLPEAIAQWEEALRRWPNDAELHSNLGLALLQAGRIQDAIEHFQQAVRIKPDAAATHYDFGLALERAGRIDDAVGQYEKALQLKPDWTLPQSALARLQAAP